MLENDQRAANQRRAGRTRRFAAARRLCAYTPFLTRLLYPAMQCPRSKPVRLLLSVNLAALALVAVWFRCRGLDHLPGFNGDEAWYGVKTLDLLGERDFRLQTPTGNPPNPFFFGPMALLHLVFRPSISLLRWVAVASGLGALAVNWWLCRRVFDRQTAVASTILLAILPINIAYSRFAWDASQSLLVTLPVLYLSLAALRSPGKAWALMAGAALVLAGAVLVHPTNIVAGASIAAVAATWIRRRELQRLASSGLLTRARIVALASAAMLLVALAAVWLNSSASDRYVRRIAGVSNLARPESIARCSTRFPRLITGGTVYRYVTGSRSYLEWPCPPETEGWGIDVGLFWVALAVAVWSLWRSSQSDGRREDRALISAWALQVVALLVIGGPGAMSPGFERYAICLVGPTAVLMARGGVLCFRRARRWRPLAVAVVSLAGWLVLADFQVHYFDFIRRTGGRAHNTFRTAAGEPKATALRRILRQGRGGPIWIVASEHWNEWPLRYLAMAEEHVRVVRPEQVEDSEAYRLALGEGRVWFVEFWDSEQLEQVRRRLAGRKLRQWRVDDYAGDPILCILHAETKGVRRQKGSELFFIDGSGGFW